MLQQILLGYVYTFNGRRREIWADNADDLKRKVLAKSPPWNDAKVPKVKEVKIIGGNVEVEEIPASFRIPWCKSNYKRY